LTRAPGSRLRSLKLTLAYDGTNYVGWQRQINGLSVQQLVEESLAPMEPGGRPPTVVGAGRTDAGVHALGQVASVNLASDESASTVQRAMNSRLPADIRVIGAIEAPLGFHAQFHALAKCYRYRIVTTPVLSPFDRWFTWHHPLRYDVDAMRRGAAAFIGRHDFFSFQARGAFIRETTRTLTRVDVRDLGGEIVIDVEGDGFLRQMVRTMVGTLVEVGRGAQAPEWVTDVIAARDRQAAGPTAPAAGLTLVSVKFSADSRQEIGDRR
jgi:tRNA pseudouridine38-40 synthase